MKKSPSTRRTLVLLWIAGAFFLAAIILYPVSNGLTRAAGVALSGVLTLDLLMLWWRYRLLRWPLLALYLAVSVFVTLPGRKQYDRLALRQEIVRALQRYEGVRYVWGGENFLGIDCSGLVRRGTIDGTFRYGLRTLNPLLVRKAAVLWWHDVSAQEMGAGARGVAKKVTEEKSIVLMDDKNLHPGDFAITRGGIHALAYLGDHIWLEADPSEMKVIRVNALTTKNSWFQQPISILRWQFLEIQHPIKTH